MVVGDEPHRLEALAGELDGAPATRAASGGESELALSVGGLEVLPLRAVAAHVDHVERVGGVQPPAVEREALAGAHALVEDLELRAGDLVDGIGQRQRLGSRARVRHPAPAGELAALYPRRAAAAASCRSTAALGREPAGRVVTCEVAGGRHGRSRRSMRLASAVSASAR